MSSGAEEVNLLRKGENMKKNNKPKLSRSELLKLLQEVAEENRQLGGTMAGNDAAVMNLVQAETDRRNYRTRLRKTLGSTLYILVGVAAVTILIATLFLPVLRVTGTSMEPTVTNGSIAAAIRTGSFEQGDIVAFYYNNKILLKRVIALAGDWIDIDEDGNVRVNGMDLYEPYLSEKSLGECDIEFPFQVPDGRIFVMGDHRATSVDSRSSQIGCVAEEMIVGKVIFCVWPLSRFGWIN